MKTSLTILTPEDKKIIDDISENAEYLADNEFDVLMFLLEVKLMENYLKFELCLKKKCTHNQA